MLIKYIKGVLWRVAKCLSYIEDTRCLKVKRTKLGAISAVPFLSWIQQPIPHVKSQTSLLKFVYTSILSHITKPSCTGYVVTTRNRIFLQKLTVPQLVNKFPTHKSQPVVFFLLLHRAFWYIYSSLTNKCTFINLKNTLKFTLKYI